MTFKLTQEQTKTIQAAFDKQSPGNRDYDCWEGINKQLQTAKEELIKINEEGKEKLVVFYMKIVTPNEKFSIHKMKVHRD